MQFKYRFPVSMVLILISGLISNLFRFDLRINNNNLILIYQFLFSLNFLILFAISNIFSLKKYTTLIVLGLYTVIYAFPLQFLEFSAKINRITYYYTPNFGDNISFDPKKIIENSDIYDKLQNRKFNIGILIDFPHKVIFYIITMTILIYLIKRVLKFRNDKLIFFSIITIVILIYSWFHVSYGSPYVYMVNSWPGSPPNHWHVITHFKNGSGATIADHIAISTNISFLHNNLIQIGSDWIFFRRILSSFWVSGFSPFINEFYLWVFLNILFWVSAAIGMYYFVSSFSTKLHAYISAVLVATGIGFVAFVGTTQMYLMSYALLPISLGLLTKLAKGSDSKKLNLSIITIISTFNLIYDVIPILLISLIYIYFIHKSKNLAILFIVFNFFINLCWSILIKAINEIEIYSNWQTDLIRNSLEILMNKFSELAITDLPEIIFVANQINEVLSNTLPIFGVLFCILTALIWKNHMKYFLLTSVAILLFTNVFFIAGEQWIGTLPRLIYPATIMLYIFIAKFIEFCFSNRKLFVVGIIYLILMLGIGFVDIFGFYSFALDYQFAK